MCPSQQERHQEVERMFAPLTQDLERFARMHALTIEKYRSENWLFHFHLDKRLGPQGIIRVGTKSNLGFNIGFLIFLDDFDTFVRQIYWSEPWGADEITPHDLIQQLEELLLDVKNWDGSFSQSSDTTREWSGISKEALEKMAPRYKTVKF